jgi:multidrug efflux system membrane fusion protein
MESISYKRALLVLVILLSVQFLVGCSPDTARSNSAPPDVEVAKVIYRQIEDWDVFNGRVMAIDAVDVRPRVTGYITRVAYIEGGLVQKGDLLFIIDQRPYRAVLDSARAQLERAHATERNARLQNERAQTLLTTSATSLEKAEDKRATWEQSLADLHAAESAVTSAALNLSFTEVRAPVSGRTSRAILTVGNLAAADQTVLTSVVSQDPVYVYFDPDEQSYLRYRAAARSSTTSPAPPLPVRVGLANDESFPFTGDVNFIDNQVDPGTGTIRIRAVVANSAGALTPGLYARVQFSGSGARSAILVSDRAILTDQNRKYVYVVGPENKVIRKDVTAGKIVSGLRVIESGLGRNDRIVVGGLQKIYASDIIVTPHMTQLKPTDGVDSMSSQDNASGR